MTASNSCCEKCENNFGGGSSMLPLVRGCKWLDCPCHKETPAAVVKMSGYREHHPTSPRLNWQAEKVEIVQDAKTGEVLEANGVKFSYEKKSPQPAKEWWEEEYKEVFYRDFEVYHHIDAKYEDVRDLVRRIAAQSEKKGREDENRAWLEGRRCDQCGKDKPAHATWSTCEDCL